MQDYPGSRRLEPAADDWTADGSQARAVAVARRDSGVRHARRISTWTAAALVASVAASAGYFAHAVATPATSSTGVTSTAGTSAGQKPSITHPVVTSGGSGVAVGAVGGATGGSGGAVHWRDN